VGERGRVRLLGVERDVEHAVGGDGVLDEVAVAEGDGATDGDGDRRGVELVVVDLDFDRFGESALFGVFGFLGVEFFAAGREGGGNEETEGECADEVNGFSHGFSPSRVMRMAREYVGMWGVVNRRSE